MNFCATIKRGLGYFMSTSSKRDIALGSTVTDAQTGFTGYAVQRLDYLNGNTQYIIQPKMTEGDKGYPEGVGLDYHQLDVIDDGISSRTIAPAQEVIIQLGQKVEDRATGLVGIATVRSLYQNGCTSFLVVPKYVTSGTAFNENPRGDWIDHGRLKVVGSGLIDEVKPSVDPETGQRRGGPPTRMRQSPSRLHR